MPVHLQLVDLRDRPATLALTLLMAALGCRDTPESSGALTGPDQAVAAVTAPTFSQISAGEWLGSSYRLPAATRGRPHRG